MRFSMRGLIVLVLAIGACLGWIVRSADVQRQAVKAIEKAGGAVFYEWQFRNDLVTPKGRPWWPRLMVDRIGVDYFGNVVYVFLHQPATAADLSHVGQLSQLYGLSLRGSAMTDAGLANLERLTRLRMLNLSLTQVSDAGLVHLERLTELRELRLHETRVSDAGLVHLRACQNSNSCRSKLTDERCWAASP